MSLLVTSSRGATRVSPWRQNHIPKASRYHCVVLSQTIFSTPLSLLSVPHHGYTRAVDPYGLEIRTKQSKKRPLFPSGMRTRVSTGCPVGQRNYILIKSIPVIQLMRHSNQYCFCLLVLPLSCLFVKLKPLLNPSLVPSYSFYPYCRCLHAYSVVHIHLMLVQQNAQCV